MFFYTVLLLSSCVILYGTAMPVEKTDYQEDFLDTDDSAEIASEDSKGTIGLTRYNPESWHTWELYAPVIGNRKFTFVFNVSLMDIEAENEIHIPGVKVMLKRFYHASENCPDFLMIQDRKYCGTITGHDAPLVIRVPDVDFMRIDFRSDSDTQGRGFLASYEWRLQQDSPV